MKKMLRAIKKVVRRNKDVILLILILSCAVRLMGQWSIAAMLASMVCGVLCVSWETRND